MLHHHWVARSSQNIAVSTTRCEWEHLCVICQAGEADVLGLEVSINCSQPRLARTTIQ